MGIEYIAAIKKSKGITTEQLSEASGVPMGTLNKILSGQTDDPRFETLKSICKALGIRLSDLDDNSSFQEGITGDGSSNITHALPEGYMKAFNEIDEEGQELIKLMIRHERDRCNMQQDAHYEAEQKRYEAEQKKDEHSAKSVG